MPSDDRVTLATAAVADRIVSFRSALATTVEEVRGVLTAQRPSANGQVDRFQGELGPFASGRIDIERFAALFGVDDSATPTTIERVERALDVLSGLLAQKDALFHVRVESGRGLYATVSDALRHVGTAFGAARVVAMARAGTYRDTEHAPWLESFGFEHWNRAERQVAPPLIVEVDGRDCRPSGLADFLDGRVIVVLVVNGPSPPAPLVRLISPGVFVLQTADEAHMDRLAACEGPAIAAMVPERAARFIHDPAAGEQLSDRLQVEFIPQETIRKPLAGMSAAQHAQELEQLTTLAGAARASAAPEGDHAASSAPADPAEKLAAWLLSQADLGDVS